MNQQVLITTIQTVWLREHNRVAQQLAQLMPGRDDEFLFQEARRIVVAEMQHITYTKYLPVIIGSQHQLFNICFKFQMIRLILINNLQCLRKETGGSGDGS